jgi:hypothetical protein
MSTKMVPYFGVASAGKAFTLLITLLQLSLFQMVSANQVCVIDTIFTFPIKTVQLDKVYANRLKNPEHIWPIFKLKKGE